MISAFVDWGSVSSLPDGGDERTLVVTSCVDDIPDNCDGGETSEYGGGVIHASRSNRDCSRHTEQDDRERDPDNGNDVLANEKCYQTAENTALDRYSQSPFQTCPRRMEHP